MYSDLVTVQKPILSKGHIPYMVSSFSDWQISLYFSQLTSIFQSWFFNLNHGTTFAKFSLLLDNKFPWPVIFLIFQCNSFWFSSILGKIPRLFQSKQNSPTFPWLENALLFFQSKWEPWSCFCSKNYSKASNPSSGSTLLGSRYNRVDTLAEVCAVSMGAGCCAVSMGLTTATGGAVVVVDPISPGSVGSCTGSLGSCAVSAGCLRGTAGCWAAGVMGCTAAAGCLISGGWVAGWTDDAAVVA